MTAPGTSAPTAQMQAALRRLSAQAPAVARMGLTLAGESIVSEAQYTAPIKNGVLKDSHGLSSLGRNADGSFASTRSITLYANTDYALARHERWPDKPGHRWFATAIVEHGPRSLEGALALALSRVGGAA